MSRLIIVSNRVAPISEGEPAAGGLAIGVYDALKETGGMWFGWSGEVVASGAPQPQIRIEERGPVTFATVGLSRRDYDQYYRGFSNATLWPAFHYRADLIHYDRHDFDGYRRVNVWLAQQLVPLLQDDDVIWVHDYHLIPFARALRDAGVKNRIGFFLHIPFPAAQVLVNVPPHRELVESLCAFDLLGFQTEPDLRAFCDYVEFEAGGEVERDGRNTVRVRAFGQTLCAAAYPIGVYPDEIASLAQAGEHGKAVRTLATSLRGRQLIMSVDRLDYSKGLVERFRAFEKLLEHQASIRNRVSFLQIAPSTRADLRAYQDIRLQLEAESGRINGRYAELDWAPILYIHRQYDRQVLAALYRLARVGFVTPLRDGMNLVAKEYVSAQNPDDPGVLVLSRFAGAAREDRKS
ncbi:MAG: trehalose-6-phosphate synthase, partial [Burkholderia sp.]|nr:trehalose-6-phosphate synthase [Burkholderia sp.]